MNKLVDDSWDCREEKKKIDELGINYKSRGKAKKEDEEMKWKKGQEKLMREKNKQTTTIGGHIVFCLVLNEHSQSH